MTDPTELLSSEQTFNTSPTPHYNSSHFNHNSQVPYQAYITQADHQDIEAETPPAPTESSSLLSPAKNIRKTAFKVSVSSKICLALCTTLPFIIAISVILAESDDDCDKPIRTWLFVTLATICTSLGFYLLFNVVVLHCLDSKSVGLALVIQGLNGLLGLFFTAWVIVGSVWLFDDSSCKDDFEDGYNMTLAILIMSFISYACLAMVICCVFCCGAVGLGAMAFSKMGETN